MRVFGFEIKRRDESTDRYGEHIKHHSNWINHLHERISEIFNKHETHKEQVNDFATNVNQWIMYLHENHNNHDKKISKIEENIKDMIRSDLKKYHRNMMFHIEDMYLEMQEKMEALHQQISLQEPEPMNLPTPSLPEKKIETIIPKIELTSPEKELVSIMFNQNTPMTYSDLARVSGKSINSIRVYMNSAKNKKDLIEEFKKPNGEKIFSIKNKQKVQTLFNVH